MRKMILSVSVLFLIMLMATPAWAIFGRRARARRAARRGCSSGSCGYSSSYAVQKGAVQKSMATQKSAQMSLSNGTYWISTAGRNCRNCR